MLTKRVQCFSNNKPWVTPDLKALLLEKRRAFQSGDRDKLKRVQRALESKIKECRRKMEDHLQQNNPREVWRGLQAISGQGKDERRNAELEDKDWANNNWTDDAVIYLLQRSLSLLEDTGNTVRITIFCFSGAFNTIHPLLLRVKLERAGASDQLAAWVTNYLSDGPFCEAAGLCVQCGGLQHRCPLGNSPLTFPLHPVHIGLHILHGQLPPPEVLR